MITYTNMHYSSGDKYVLLQDVLKVFAKLNNDGITVTFGDK